MGTSSRLHVETRGDGVTGVTAARQRRAVTGRVFMTGRAYAGGIGVATGRLGLPKARVLVSGRAT
jgi:hypothetical protein